MLTKVYIQKNIFLNLNKEGEILMNKLLTHTKGLLSQNSLFQVDGFSRIVIYIEKINTLQQRLTLSKLCRLHFKNNTFLRIKVINTV